MPINSVRGVGVKSTNKIAFKAETAKTQDAPAAQTAAQANATVPVTDKKEKKSKAVVVTSAIALAALGLGSVVYYAKKHKKVNTQKMGENIKETVEEIIDHGKKSGKETSATAEIRLIEAPKVDLKTKARQEIQEFKNKAVDVPFEEVTAPVNEAVEKAAEVAPAKIEAVVPKAETVAPKVEEAATKAEVFVPKVEETASKAETVAPKVEAEPVKNMTRSKKEKIVDVVDTLAVNAERKDRINAIDVKCADEIFRIVNQNNFGGYINVPVLENSARMFAADVNRPDRFDQAASLLEKSYKRAYFKSHPDHTSEGIGNVLNRIKNESSLLFETYAQMPYEHAVERLTVFGQNLRAKGYKISDGVTPNDFIREAKEAFDKFLQK